MFVLLRVHHDSKRSRRNSGLFAFPDEVLDFPVSARSQLADIAPPIPPSRKGHNRSHVLRSPAASIFSPLYGPDEDDDAMSSTTSGSAYSMDSPPLFTRGATLSRSTMPTIIVTSPTLEMGALPGDDATMSHDSCRRLGEATIVGGSEAAVDQVHDGAAFEDNDDMYNNFADPFGMHMHATAFADEDTYNSFSDPFELPQAAEVTRVMPSIEEQSEDDSDVEELGYAELSLGTDRAASPTTAATMLDDRVHDSPADSVHASLELSTAVVSIVQSSSLADSIGSLESISLNSLPTGAGSGLRATATLGMQQAKRQSTSEYVRGLSAAFLQRWHGEESASKE